MKTIYTILFLIFCINSLCSQSIESNIDDDDIYEYNLLSSIGITDSTSIGIKFEFIQDYIKWRNFVFGSKENYVKFSKISDQELVNYGDRIRDIIFDYEGNSEKYFYRWIKKGFESQGYVDVVSIIKDKYSKQVLKILENLKVKLLQDSILYKRDALGNFETYEGKLIFLGVESLIPLNPRPKKLNGLHRLGTISNHSFGTAIDILPKFNKQIQQDVFRYILEISGIEDFDRDSSQFLYSDNTETDLIYENKAFKLYNNYFNLNNLFLHNFKLLTIDEKYKDQLNECFNNGKGFINLSWKIVNALRKSGFGWGATFLNPDFMHFDYPIWKLHN